MNIEIRPIKDIRTAKYNPRKISDGQLASLKQSIERFGFVDPVIVNDRTGVLVGGHQRIKAAKELGLKQVPVVAVNLDEAEEKALNVALNKISGEWDLDLLRGVLEDVQAGGLELSLTGFTDEEWSAMSGSAVGGAGLTDPDEVPEPPEEAEAVTQPGDLWLLGSHRLLCGDSTNPKHVERLMDGGTAGLLLTDPPYGINISANPVRQKHQKKNWDAEPIDDPTLAYFNQLAPASIIWGGNYFGLPPAQCFYVWDKKQPEDFSLAMCELAWTNIPGPAKMFRLSVTSYKKDHPTQKPVELLEWCLSKAEGLVLDPFGGSGSTLIACEKTSRHCRMMELDPAYCDVIVRRWEQFTGKKAVRDAG